MAEARQELLDDDFGERSSAGKGCPVLDNYGCPVRGAFFLIRSDHWGWKREIYFFLRTLAVVVIIQGIVWAIKARTSRVK
jgi:hypothetical protein